MLVVIVGAGLSGTLLAVNLLRQSSCEIMLVERERAFGRGVAYSTRFPEHRLNVSAANMSALPDEPRHFAEWLGGKSGEGTTAFAARGDYGAYIEDLLRSSERAHPGRLRRLEGEAIAISKTTPGYEVALDGGDIIAADVAVLALGNLPAAGVPGIETASLSADSYVADPWSRDFTAGLQPGDRVAVIGTGLTMVDVTLRLAASGCSGGITAISRRGLLPRAHLEHPAAPAEPDDGADAAHLSRLLRHVRAHAAVIGWRGAVDALRPITQRLWAEAPAPVRARFLRHLRPWWDVHRHRLAPAVAARLEELRAAGIVQVEAGRLLEAVPAAGGLRLSWQRRGSGEVVRQDFRRLINCIGPQDDPERSQEPLLRQLVSSGLVRRGSNRLGIDVTTDGEVRDAEGRADPHLLAIGPTSRTALWEIIAVPDIRVQAQAMARRIARQAIPPPLEEPASQVD